MGDRIADGPVRYSQFERQSLDVRVRCMATDLDGTLLPLVEDPAAMQAMRVLGDWFAVSKCPLVFVTGRHMASVVEAMDTFQTPLPETVLCDVGASCYQRVAIEQDGAGDDRFEVAGVAYVRQHSYDRALAKLTAGCDLNDVRSRIADLPGFRLQEAEKQGDNKLSYYVDASELEASRERLEDYLSERELPLGVIASIDPFHGSGLVDVLPAGVSKAWALEWMCREFDLRPCEVLFCGDSSNDLHALTAGFCSGLVGNADRSLAARVQESHRKAGWLDRLFLSKSPSTLGVLDIMRWFGLLTGLEEGSVATPITQDTEPTMDRQFGAVPVGHRKTRFRVWAPEKKVVAVEIHSQETTHPGNRTHSRLEPLNRVKDGFHEATVDGVPPGSRYRFRFGQVPHAEDHSDWVDQEHWSEPLPDPASRYQPDGVHGASEVINPQYAWQHDDVARCHDRRDWIIYECHLGTFTREGTFESAIDRLDELVELGVTVIELMPVAACAGRWNWGYDGVYWYAPMGALGRPGDFRRFVDEAHRRGLLVIVDVVYNHVGPEGNHLDQYGPYFSERHQTPWGGAPNVDDPEHGKPMRRFVVESALMLFDEYHVDGLRVDAIHCMADDSEPHIVTELSTAVNEWSQRTGRPAHMIAESNVYDEYMCREVESSGHGFTAQWCDDFLHSVFASLRPGEHLTTREYRSHSDLAMVLKRGHVFRGDVRGFRGRDEGDSGAIDRSELIYCIQNHDFIGNHPLGQRLHQITSCETQAAATGLLLCSPAIPMLFMGEEFACDHAFSFFVDFQDATLQRAVIEGRQREYPQHDWSNGHLPTLPDAFDQSKIGAASAGNAVMRRWYQSLIHLRRRWRAAGLLDSRNLEVTTDEQLGLFRMDYRLADRHAVVACRLVSDPHVRDDACQIQGVPGRRILESRGVDGVPHGGVYPNQCVIWENLG
ncbi:MAG: HAD-IIB family hydrolase [Planctomycetota bacterium]